MTSISNSYSLPYNVTGRSQENRIYEKVCLIGKKIFHYLSSNQRAIQAGIFSYLLIETYVTASEFIQTGPNEYMSCQDMLCNSWTNSGLDHQDFSPIIQFRCDPSHPFYARFPFIDKCMNTLCDYMNRVGRQLPECVESSFNNSLSYPLNLFWRKLCPNKVSMQQDLQEFCLTDLCTENDIFIITMDLDLRKLCSNEKIQELIHSIYRAIGKLKKFKLETTEWNQKDLLISLLRELANTVSIMTSQLKKTYNLKTVIDPTVMDNEIIYNFRNGIEKIFFVGSEMIEYMVNDLINNRNFTNKFRDNLLKVSDKLDNLFVYPEQTIQGELGNSIDQFVPYSENNTLNLIAYRKEIYDTLSLPVFSNGIPSLKRKQYKLLLHSIYNWASSYCFYTHPKTILCRLPLPSSVAKINEVFLGLRNFYVKNLFCHFIKDDYWCDFGKFFKAVCNRRNITRIGKCFWDHMILQLEKTPDNKDQINLVGDCYHEIFIVKKC